MRRVKFLLFAIAVSIFFYIESTEMVLADGDDSCRGNPHHCGGGSGGSNGGSTVDTDVVVDVTTGDQTMGDIIGGDTTISSGGNRALSLSNGLGDVAIRDCRESEQWATPLLSRQYVELNPWCAAEWYDSRGRHLTAAKLRCTDKTIKKLYKKKQDCWDDNTIFYESDPVVEELVVVGYGEEEEEDIAHSELEKRLDSIERERAEDLRRSAAYAARQSVKEQEQINYAKEALSALEQYQ